VAKNPYTHGANLFCDGNRESIIAAESTLPTPETFHYTDILKRNPASFSKISAHPEGFSLSGHSGIEMILSQH
jgi:hypothetical protein